METKYLIGLVVGVSIFILLLNVLRITFSSNNDIIGLEKNGYNRGSDGVENFQNLNPAPLDNKIGRYDGNKLTNCPKSFWRHPPANEKLVTGNMYVPQGTPLPLIPTSSGPMTSGPEVDGASGSPKDMFMFAYNQCKPECCPSTYSCSGGCVCTTKKQRAFVGQNRGNNKNYTDDSI